MFLKNSQILAIQPETHLGLLRGLKNFIGRFNITQGFLDSLGHVIQGLLGFLSESGVLIGAHLNVSTPAVNLNDGSTITATGASAFNFDSGTSNSALAFTVTDGATATISTTGATISEIRDLLTHAGCRHVYGLVVAHG